MFPKCRPPPNRARMFCFPVNRCSNVGVYLESNPGSSKESPGFSLFSAISTLAKQSQILAMLKKLIGTRQAPLAIPHLRFQISFQMAFCLPSWLPAFSPANSTNTTLNQMGSVRHTTHCGLIDKTQQEHTSASKNKQWRWLLEINRAKIQTAIR